MSNANSAEMIGPVIETLQGMTDVRDLTGSSPLVSTRILDSVNMIRLVSRLEERFQIRFADDDLSADNFETAERIAQLCATRRAARN